MEQPMTDFRWNFSDLYSGDDDPRIETDIKAARDAAETFATKWRGRDDYLREAGALAEALADYQKLQREHGSASRPGYYLWLRRSVDQNNTALKAKLALVEREAAEISNLLKFFLLSVGTTALEAQKTLLADERLVTHRYWLSRVYDRAKYNFSEQTEQVLELIEPQATSSWIDMIEEILAGKIVSVWDGEREAELPFNSALELLTSSDLKVVDSAGQAVNAVMAEVAPLAERELNAVVTTSAREIRLRGYDTPEAARYHADELDSAVVEAMLSTVEKRFDLPRRYYALLAKLLSQDKLKYWQRSVTLGKIDTRYTFEEAVDSVGRAIGRLDADFAERLRDAVDRGYIDAEPRAGKSGGAFCAYIGPDEPNYLMLNFTGGLRDVETLAHEFGHYLNFVYMKQECDALSYAVPTPLAEVTSTFNEKFILDELLATADDETKLAVMLSNLSNEAATIFRQTAAMRFEQELYRQVEAQGYLPYDVIGELFARHMADYMGDAVEMTAGSANWWVYWSHLRRMFYNYSYSFALLVAKALQSRLAADPGFIVDYKRLLAAGSRQDPIDLLASMGLDVKAEAFWRAGIDDFERSLDEAEALAKKLGKIS